MADQVYGFDRQTVSRIGRQLRRAEHTPTGDAAEHSSANVRGANVALIRITSITPDANGYYSALIQDRVDETWADTDCVVSFRDPNEVAPVLCRMVAIEYDYDAANDLPVFMALVIIPGGGGVNSVTGLDPLTASPTTGDVVVTIADAGYTQKGVVNLVTQLFKGPKLFDSGIAVGFGGGATTNPVNAVNEFKGSLRVTNTQAVTDAWHGVQIYGGTSDGSPAGLIIATTEDDGTPSQASLEWFPQAGVDHGTLFLRSRLGDSTTIRPSYGVAELVAASYSYHFGVWGTAGIGATVCGGLITSLGSTSAGGDLTGSYPNPTIGAHKVTAAKLSVPLQQALSSLSWGTPGVESSNAIEIVGTVLDATGTALPAMSTDITIIVSDSATDADPSATATITAAGSPVGTLLSGTGTATVVMRTDSGGTFKIRVTEATATVHRYLWIKAGGNTQSYVRSDSGVVELVYS